MFFYIYSLVYEQIGVHEIQRPYHKIMTQRYNFLRLLGDPLKINELEKAINTKPSVAQAVSGDDSDTDSSDSIEVTGTYKSLPPPKIIRAKQPQKDDKPGEVPYRFDAFDCSVLIESERSLLDQRAYINILRILNSIQSAKNCEYIVCQAIDAYIYSVCVQLKKDYKHDVTSDRKNIPELISHICMHVLRKDPGLLSDILKKEDDTIRELGQGLTVLIDDTGKAISHIDRIENMGLYPGYVWKWAHRILFMRTLHSNLQNYYNQDEVVIYETANISLDYVTAMQKEEDILVLVSYDFLTKQMFSLFAETQTNVQYMTHDNENPPNVCIALDTMYLTAHIVSLTGIPSRQPIVLFRNPRNHPYSYQNGYYCVQSSLIANRPWLSLDYKYPVNNSENNNTNKNRVTVGESAMTHMFMTSEGTLAAFDSFTRKMYVEKIRTHTSTKTRNQPENYVAPSVISRYLAGFPENNFFAYRQSLRINFYFEPHMPEYFYLPHPQTKKPAAFPNIRYNGVLKRLMLYQLNNNSKSDPKSIRQLAPGNFLSENVLYNYINTAHELYYPNGTIANREFSFFVAGVGDIGEVDLSDIKQIVINTDNDLDEQALSMVHELMANDKTKSSSYFGILVNQGKLHWAFGVFVVTSVNDTSVTNFYVFDSLSSDKTICKKYQLLMVNFVLKYRVGWSSQAKRIYEETETKKEIVYVENVPKQSSSSNNCGLFAALFAVSFKRSLADNKTVKINSFISSIYSDIESEVPLVVKNKSNETTQKMVPEKLREELYKFAKENIVPPQDQKLGMIAKATAGKSKIPPKRSIHPRPSRATVVIDVDDDDEDGNNNNNNNNTDADDEEDDGETLYTQEQRDRRAQTLLRAEMHQARYRENLYTKRFKSMLERAEKETDPDKKASLFAAYQYNVRKKQLRDEYYVLFHATDKTPEDKLIRKNKLKENARLDHQLEIKRENMQLLEGELNLLEHAEDSKEYAIVSKSLAERREHIQKLEKKTSTVGREFDSDDDDDDDDDLLFKDKEDTKEAVNKPIVIDIDDDDDDDDKNEAVDKYNKFINKS